MPKIEKLMIGVGGILMLAFAWNFNSNRKRKKTNSGSTAEQQKKATLQQNSRRREEIAVNPSVFPPGSVYFDALDDLSDPMKCDQAYPESETDSFLEQWEIFQKAFDPDEPASFVASVDETDVTVDNCLSTGDSEDHSEELTPSFSLDAEFRAVYGEDLDLTEAEFEEIQMDADRMAVHDWNMDYVMAWNSGSPVEEMDAESFYGDSFPAGSEFDFPLFRPEIGEDELKALREAVRSAPLAVNPFREDVPDDLDDALNGNTEVFYDRQMKGIDSWNIIEQQEDEEAVSAFDLDELIAELEEDLENELCEPPGDSSV